MRGDQRLSPQARPLIGKVAVVTGASSGIGAATAAALARGGADILLHARQNRAGLEQISRDVESYGAQSRLLLADLAEPSEQDRLMQEAWVWRGRADIWINNAGADVLTGEAAAWTFERKLETVWRVDVVATLRLSRQVGEQMRLLADGQDRSIINIGWDQAAQGMAGDSGEMFAATKGAVMAFSRSLAQSLAPHVRVNCVAPGWIRTAWAEQASGQWQERAATESLMQRWGTPDDVAAAIVFLASPAASFITGQMLPVNGGFRYGHQ
jgi:3-oxoacyl-[acyl-carrier protein] reductase